MSPIRKDLLKAWDGTQILGWRSCKHIGLPSRQTNVFFFRQSGTIIGELSFVQYFSILSHMEPGLTAFSTPAHIARATLEAASYHTRAVLDAIEEQSGEKVESLTVDGVIHHPSRIPDADTF